MFFSTSVSLVVIENFQKSGVTLRQSMTKKTTAIHIIYVQIAIQTATITDTKYQQPTITYVMEQLLNHYLSKAHMIFI